MLTAPKVNNSLKIINVESTINELPGDKTQYQMWPHLGILYVGTTARELGWDVELHDELIEGYVDLETMISPGDIVGLSLVATGINRGLELAIQAKNLGASYVIVGNDAAIFRANQILSKQKAIDAVFTGNSLQAIRSFLTQIRTTKPVHMSILGMSTNSSSLPRLNSPEVIKNEKLLLKKGLGDGSLSIDDVFIVPDFSLYKDAYWQKVWKNYRQIFGHKHHKPAKVKNGLSLFAQGCTRTGVSEVCSYCTIAGVADIRIPTHDHLERLLSQYHDFGINYVFNTTDSIFEMQPVVKKLHELGAHFEEGMMIYGRAWGLANRPKMIDQWLELTGGRLYINVGMDSGDESILQRGVNKATQKGGRLSENRAAINNIASSGAHLHYSLIFGSPGETLESTKRSLDFFEWSRDRLGAQLDQCESDIYWLNHGSPSSRVFHDFQYASMLAELAGKSISKSVWESDFYVHRNTISVPWSCQESWYRHFTSITISDAYECINYIAEAMGGHTDAAPGRTGVFLPG